MKLLRMKPGHGEIVLAEGDVEVPEQERELIEAFRRELDAGMWAAVPTETPDGRREAELVKSFAEVPRDAERVIFFPRAAGGAPAGDALAPMALALGTAAVVLVVLLWELVAADAQTRASRAAALSSWRRAGARRRRAAMTPAASVAPSSARARCCARASTSDDWAMYRDLGFLRVWGGLGERGRGADAPLRLPDLPAQADRRLRARRRERC